MCVKPAKTKCDHMGGVFINVPYIIFYDHDIMLFYQSNCGLYCTYEGERETEREREREREISIKCI